MTFDSIIGQQDVKRRLGSALKGVPGHAYVFIGPSGSGKTTLARSFAQALLCQRATAKGACGQCTSCRHFGNQVHPDFISLELAPKEKTIKVETVRSKVSADIAMHPQFGSRKVYLIDADNINEQGQNALLKSLEEPPAYVHYLLTVAGYERLLPTVRSRVVPVVMQRLSVDEIRQVLTEKEIPHSELTAFYARFSGGLPGVAVNLAGSEWFSSLRQETIRLYKSFSSQSRAWLLTEGFQFFEKNRDQADIVLEILGSLIRDQLMLVIEEQNLRLTNEDQRDMLMNQPIINMETAKAKERLNRAHKALLQAHRGLDANASFEGLACQILLALRKELTHA